LRVRCARVGLGVLLQLLQYATDDIDLALDAVERDDGLVAIAERLEVFRFPLRAVVIAPRHAGFGVLVGLGAEEGRQLLLEP
jgi:hypothetical protein